MVYGAHGALARRHECKLQTSRALLPSSRSLVPEKAGRGAAEKTKKTCHVKDK